MLQTGDRMHDRLYPDLQLGNMKAGKNKTQRPDHDENNQMMNEMEEF